MEAGSAISGNKDTVALVLIYIGLEGIYSGENRDSALYYLQLANRIDNKKNNHIHISIQNNWGRYYLTHKQPEKAIPYLIDAITIAQRNNDLQVLLTSSFNLGEAYYQTKSYKKAEHILSNTFLTAKKINYSDIHTIKGGYDILSKVYEALGDNKLVIEYQKKSIILQDSIIQMERDQSANELETAARTAEKNKELAQNKLLLLLKNNQLKEKNFFIAFTSIAVLFLVLLSFSFYRNSKHKQKLQEEKINTLQQEQEIRQLRAIVNGEEKERARVARELHDGIASQLITVKLNLDLLRKKKNKIVEIRELDGIFQQLHEATIELRKTAQNLIPDIIIENGLETALQILCEKIEDNTKIKVNLEVFGTLPRLHSDIELSLYRMIQELLQNVLKHAQATQILIQFLYRNQLLSITIEDNGKGFSRGIKYKGSGLKNVEERTKMLNGTMIINSNKGLGTIIYMEFDAFKLQKDKINAY